MYEIMYDQVLFCQKDMEESRKCIKRLIDHSPHTLNWQDFEGRTPLHLAVTNEDPGNCETLLNTKR
jgi:ankyrin repeat protein